MAKLPVVESDVIPGVQRPLIRLAVGSFEFRQYRKVQVERIAKLVARAQDGAVDGFAQQEHLEPVTIGVSLEKWLDPPDLLVGVGDAPVLVHRDGDLHRHRQHPQVILAMTFPPCLKDILAELHCLNMRAAQVQSPHLVDNEVAQRLVISAQEPAIRLKVL